MRDRHGKLYGRLLSTGLKCQVRFRSETELEPLTDIRQSQTNTGDLFWNTNCRGATTAVLYCNPDDARSQFGSDPNPARVLAQRDAVFDGVLDQRVDRERR